MLDLGLSMTIWPNIAYLLKKTVMHLTNIYGAPTVLQVHIVLLSVPVLALFIFTYVASQLVTPGMNSVGQIYSS